MIAIADHHALCRSALIRYIRQAEPSFDVREFARYDELENYLRHSAPDCVLVECRLPGWAGGAFPAGMIDPAKTRTGVILPFSELHGTEAGGVFPFDAVFPRTLSSKDMLEGIVKLCAGEGFTAPGDLFPPPQDALLPAAPRANLTLREKDVLAFLLKGASNKEIARALDLQVVTIKLHVRGICRKLGAANRTQAALIAKEKGYR